jgi:hypothetical protein
MHSSIVVGTFLLVGTLVTLFAVATHAVELRAGRSVKEAQRSTLRLAGAQIAWIALTGAASALGLYSNFYDLPPKLPLTLLTSIIALVAFSRSKQYARILRFAPLAWPIALQSMRTLVELGLWRLHRDGLLPQHLTFEGYNFDILVGLTAPAFAFGINKGWISRRVAIAWNFGSIGFLITIVFMAITSAPGPQHLPWPGVPNTVLGLFPTVWLPTFIVPVAIFGHVTSLRQLFSIQRTSSATRMATRATATAE